MKQLTSIVIRYEHADVAVRQLTNKRRDFLDGIRIEACKRLVKNGIICWNYLYLPQKPAERDDAASHEAFLFAVANGSAVS